jgi:hypothetical protein
MTTTTLPFPNLDGVISEHEVEFPVQRHRYRHVREEGSEGWHLVSAHLLVSSVVTLPCMYYTPNLTE